MIRGLSDVSVRGVSHDRYFLENVANFEMVELTEPIRMVRSA